MGTLPDEPLGRGGEGSVYRVDCPGLGQDLVAKLYHQPSQAQQDKCQAMVQARPATDSICWPKALVWARGSDGGAHFQGFAMDRLDSANFLPWSVLAHTKDRRAQAGGFDFRYALTAAANLAAALGAVHAAGHVVGDVNESNVFVASDATVRIIDADSAQIQGEGQLFTCTVGKPEYTASELVGTDFKQVRRTPGSDTFAWAVMVYQLVTGGAHPTDGSYAKDDEPPSVPTRIKNGWMPSLQGGRAGDLAAVPRIPAGALPRSLQQILLATLEADPKRRADLASAHAGIGQVLANLVPCDREAGHYYDRRDGRCGWCEHKARTGTDPWGTVSAAQAALPPVEFSSRNTVTPQRGGVVNTNGGPAGAVSPGGMRPGSAGMPAGSAPGGGPGANPPGVSNPVPPSGNKTLLTYADGTVKVRPPLLTLAKHQPKLALSCAWSEAPEICKPIWTKLTPGKNQGRVQALAIVATVVIILAMPTLAVAAATWITDWLAAGTGIGAIAKAGPWLGSAGALAVWVCALTLTVSRMAVAKKVHVKAGFSWADTRRYGVVSALVGPGLVLGIIAAAIGALVLLVMKIVSMMLPGSMR